MPGSTGEGAASPPDRLASQSSATEAYRQDPYPSYIHEHSHPDRLATIARLAGAGPPDIRTARVLEVGVGDGLNTLSIAQTLPDADVVGFDLEAEGIARGQERLARVGLTNVRLAVADLTDLAAIPGQFDYIIAHGVFSWVPDPVARALLAMIAERLSPTGVALVSLSTLPGGYARLAVRDGLVHATAGLTDPAQKLDRARQMLATMAKEQPGDTGPRKGFRATARDRLAAGAETLLHDELGVDYRPWYLSALLARAADLGLKLLGDASDELIAETFVGAREAAPADRQALYEFRATTSDFTHFRSFRRALLMRSDVPTPRVPDPRTIETLYAYSLAAEVAPGAFRAAPHRIQVDHPQLAAVLRHLIAAAPARVPVRALKLPDPLLIALVGLFDFGIVQLSTVPGEQATRLSDRPRASPLARDLVAERGDWCVTLNHRGATLDKAAQAALAMLDGETDRAAVTARLAAEGHDADAALRHLLREGLLLA